LAKSSSQFFGDNGERFKCRKIFDDHFCPCDENEETIVDEWEDVDEVFDDNDDPREDAQP
jgi:hypothetical protein